MVYTLFKFYIFLNKFGLVKTLLHQAFAISSKWSIFQLELDNMKELLEKNSDNYIDQQIKQYLPTQFSDKIIENLVILHQFHITKFLTLNICRKKLKAHSQFWDNFWQLKAFQK